MGRYDIDFEKHFRLDGKSPSGLSWNRVCSTKTGRIMHEVGENCISKDHYGYWIVSLNNKQYKSHIIVWKISNGAIPDGLFIDHIDGDRSNNDIDNLRVVSRSTNNRNSSKRSHNTTGYTGITIYRGCYKSKVTFNKKEYTKYFNIYKLGDENALQLAISWRTSKIEELNAQGADFSD